MNLFDNIINWVKNNFGNSNPTKNLPYRFLSQFEPQAQMATESLQDTTKMYEQKAQWAMQWGQNIANKPWLAKLGKMIKIKYPEYNDLSDEELGGKMLAKYPEYQDIVDSERTALGQWAKMLWGIGSMAVQAPWMVTGWSEQLWTGLWTIASAQSWQDVAEWGLQALKWWVTAWFWVATGAMPIASSIFGWISGTDTAQKAFGYLWEKSGNIWAWTAKLLGGNQQVQEQARWLGEIALPAVALKWVSKSGKYVKPVAQATGNAIVKWANIVAPKISQAVSKAPQALWKLWQFWAEYSTSVATWLSRETQQLIKQNPELYKQARSWDITAIGELENFKSATDQRLTDLSELWKGYQQIKKWAKVTTDKELQDIFLEQTKDINTNELTKGDLKAIKDASDYISGYKWDVLDTWLLSLRKQLDDVLYDPNTWLPRKLTPQGKRVVQWLRAWVDKLAKERIEWLQWLDEAYAPEVRTLKEIKKAIYDANGNLKDSALSTISNIVGKNKDFKLAKFEEIYPDLGKRIRALKAYEEVSWLASIKTWSIVRQWGAIALGNAALPLVGAVIWWIASNPIVAARILETYGNLKKATIEKIKNKQKISKEEAQEVAKVIKATPVEKVDKLLTKISFNPAQAKESNKTLVKPKKITK